jgi:hypothetical protein
MSRYLPGDRRLLVALTPESLALHDERWRTAFR